MFCSHCGNNLDNNAKFCDGCGAPTGAGNAPNNFANNNNINSNQNMQSNNFSNNMSSNNNFNQDGKRKKKGGCFKGCFTVILVLLALFVLFLLWPTDSETDNESSGESGTQTGASYGNGTFGEDLQLEGLRENYTVLKNDGTEVSTIMMYIIGSDLESDGGFASGDIEEMLDADFGDNVNLILMTGGAYYWENSMISGDTCQYWQIKDGELIPINEDLGLLNMAEANTLAKFINDTASAYPADRYSLIMWDHGGGTISGFGVDEYYPESTLTLASLDNAFAQSSVKFDFVGFDACLMATAETALMLEPYADYLIASQELEPGTGWHYTDWITYLSQNPSVDTVDLGVKIIDDFVRVCEDTIYNPNATLSIVELRQMPYLYSTLTDYFTNSATYITNNEYRRISVARNDAKDFGDGGCDQIDMVDYIEKADIDGGQNVISAISSAVKYYNNSSDVYDSYGLAMYFPLDYPNQYSNMHSILHDVGYTSEYTAFFDVFMSAMSGGQMQFSRSSGITLEQDYSSQDWYDEQTAVMYEETAEGEFLGELVIDEKGDTYVLSLSEEEWEEINKIELQLLLDDGEGYIDLGSDNVYEFDEDGDLIVDFDYTWVTLDGHTVPFYAEHEVVNSDDDWNTYGMVPAFLNDEDYIEIIVQWDDKNPQGYVAGYRKYSEVGTPLGKGLFELESGDVIDWVVDYYTYDWDYEDYYIFGDQYTVPSGDISVSYDYIGDSDALIYFKLTDIYNNIYETEAVIYSDY